MLMRTVRREADGLKRVALPAFAVSVDLARSIVLHSICTLSTTSFAMAAFFPRFLCCLGRAMRGAERREVGFEGKQRATLVKGLGCTIEEGGVGAVACRAPLGDRR